MKKIIKRLYFRRASYPITISLWSLVTSMYESDKIKSE